MTIEDHVCGCHIQIDRSGVGQCWVAASQEDLCPVLLEIEAEIIDGGRGSCDDYVAKNGMHFRWHPAPAEFLSALRAIVEGDGP